MNQLPVFPDNFITEKIAIRFPPELLMQLPEICDVNRLSLFPWTTLKDWLKKRIEEGRTIYVYFDKPLDQVCCFTESYWKKDKYTLLELNNLASTLADCPDILELL